MGVCQPFIQSWDVALSLHIASNGNGTAITAEKHCMMKAGRNLGVCYFLIQTWDVALFLSILRWQQPCHHCGEALYDESQQKSGCIRFPHPNLGCCTVLVDCLQWQRHGHHCREALYDESRKKSGCMLFPHPNLGCCTVLVDSPMATALPSLRRSTV